MFKELAFLIIIILPFFLLRFLRSELQIKGPLANTKAGKANKKKKKKSKKPQDAGNVSGSGTSDAIKKNNIDDEKEKSKKKNKAEKENILSAKNNEKDSDKPKISVKTGSPIKVVVSASEEDDNNDVLVNDDQEEYEQVTEDDFVHVSATKKKGATAKRKGFNVQEADFPPLPSGSRIQSDSQEPTREIDSYMDPAYFKQHRVMRIVPEENKKSNAPNRQNSSSQSTNEPLSKTQRKNQARAAKRKEEARLKEELQAERLRQHQRELEKERRKEFDKNSKPKSTAGSKGSKSNEATASVNEAGQLVWD